MNIMKRLKQILKKKENAPISRNKNKILEKEQEKWGAVIGVNPPITAPRPKHPGIK